MVDVVVHYAKKTGATSAKTFKLHGGDLPAGDSWSLHKRLSTKDLSTRVHWPGRHDVEVQVNGQRSPVGAFDLI